MDRCETRLSIQQRVAEEQSLFFRLSLRKMILGAICFHVVSEASPLRKFVVSSLEKELMTLHDRSTFTEMASLLGFSVAPLEQFIDCVRSHSYERIRIEYSHYTVEYYFPHQVHYKVGSECKVVMGYCIQPFEDSTCENLLAVNEPITYDCDAYCIHKKGWVHVKQDVDPPSVCQSSFVYDANEFPAL